MSLQWYLLFQFNTVGFILEFLFSVLIAPFSNIYKTWPLLSSIFTCSTLLYTTNIPATLTKYPIFWLRYQQPWRPWLCQREYILFHCYCKGMLINSNQFLHTYLKSIDFFIILPYTIFSSFFIFLNFLSFCSYTSCE